MRVWTASPCLQKICPFSTPCKKLARSEAWRPAAAARNRSPREAREVARQALRPGCEELAARIRVMPETEARPREPKIATVERREASVPRHRKLSLHSTPRASIRLAITNCNVGIYLYKVLLR